LWTHQNERRSADQVLIALPYRELGNAAFVDRQWQLLGRFSGGKGDGISGGLAGRLPDIDLGLDVLARGHGLAAGVKQLNLDWYRTSEPVLFLDGRHFDLSRKLRRLGLSGWRLGCGGSQHQKESTGYTGQSQGFAHHHLPLEACSSQRRGRTAAARVENRAFAPEV